MHHKTGGLPFRSAETINEIRLRRSFLVLLFKGSRRGGGACQKLRAYMVRERQALSQGGLRIQSRGHESVCSLCRLLRLGERK